MKKIIFLSTSFAVFVFSCFIVEAKNLRFVPDERDFRSELSFEIHETIMTIFGYSEEGEALQDDYVIVETKTLDEFFNPDTLKAIQGQTDEAIISGKVYVIDYPEELEENPDPHYWVIAEGRSGRSHLFNLEETDDIANPWILHYFGQNDPVSSCHLFLNASSAIH